MVWRVRFQNRVGRSAASATVQVAASVKRVRAVLRMTLALHSEGRFRGFQPRQSLTPTPRRVKMPHCDEFAWGCLAHLEPAARLRHYPAPSPVREPEKNPYGSPSPGK